MYMVQIVLEGEEQHWHYPSREIGIRTQKKQLQKESDSRLSEALRFAIGKHFYCRSGDALEAHVVVAWMGRCLQENLPDRWK